MLLKVLRGIEHLSGTADRRLRRQVRNRARGDVGPLGDAFLAEEGHDLLERGEVAVPIVEQIPDGQAVTRLAGAERTAASAAIGLMGLRQMDGGVLKHDGGKWLAVRPGESSKLEFAAVHDASPLLLHG